VYSSGLFTAANPQIYKSIVTVLDERYFTDAAYTNSTDK